MRTWFFEATQGAESGFNWGKFMVGVFVDEEYTRPSALAPASLLNAVGYNSRSIWVTDLQTGEGARFMPGGLARADLQKHRIWVCPMFEPFLEWLYDELFPVQRHGYADVLDTLPVLIELPEAPAELSGHRREGLVTPSHEEVLSALIELRILTECRCAPDWTERGRHAPECNWSFRGDVEVVAAAVASKTADADLVRTDEPDA